MWFAHWAWGTEKAKRATPNADSGALSGFVKDVSVIMCGLSTTGRHAGPAIPGGMDTFRSGLLSRGAAVMRPAP